MDLACADHVLDSEENDLVGHTGSDGSDPFDRMNRYGTWGVTAGENIAYGSDTGLAVVM